MVDVLNMLSPKDYLRTALNKDDDRLIYFLTLIYNLKVLLQFSSFRSVRSLQDLLIVIISFSNFLCRIYML